MTDSTPTQRPIRVAFIHPDLGIGGAERLIVDAALGLQENGYQVKLFTSHHDKNHCFEETKDGTLDVEVMGDDLPTNFRKKFFIFFANLRQLYLVSRLIKTKQIEGYDIFIIDQLSTCLPFLHIFSSAKLLFYCHFPDQLLSARTSILKKLYRIPFDLFEQFSISSADRVVVNSKFTRTVYKNTFKFLKNEPEVVYPCVDLNPIPIEALDRKLFEALVTSGDRFYLSINRYEKKKNIKLALRAFALSKEYSNKNAKLFIVGGYDPRVSENVEYLKELEIEARVLKLPYSVISFPDYAKNKKLDDSIKKENRVIFLTSISTSFKELLLSKTEMLMYTPSNEHFGIVPLEAMKHGKPVLAVNSGGPLETVVSYVPGENEDETNGWLRAPIPGSWSNVLDEYLTCSNIDFKSNGEKRIKKNYTRDVMTWTLEDNIEKIVWEKKTVLFWEGALMAILRLFIHLIVIKIFPGQSVPFAFLATFSFLFLKDIIGTIYWISILILTSDNFAKVFV